MDSLQTACPERVTLWYAHPSTVAFATGLELRMTSNGSGIPSNILAQIRENTPRNGSTRALSSASGMATIQQACRSQIMPRQRIAAGTRPSAHRDIARSSIPANRRYRHGRDVEISRPSRPWLSQERKPRGDHRQSIGTSTERRASVTPRRILPLPMIADHTHRRCRGRYRNAKQFRNVLKMVMPCLRHNIHSPCRQQCGACCEHTMPTDLRST